MTPTDQKTKMANELCKLANERFGLQMGMRKLLERFNLNDHAVDYVVELAQKRELEKLGNVMSMLGTQGVSKPRYVRIKNPAKAWSPSNDHDNDEHALNRIK